MDYNIIAIGGGSAGLVTSYIAAALKSKVALVEKNAMGGDCLNTGCVPSKALIKSAKFISDIKKHSQYGIKDASCEVDFAQIMDRVHAIIKKIEPHDSIARYTNLGVDCFIDQAEVFDEHTVQIGADKIVKAKNIVLCMGSSPFIPPIPGLKNIEYLTSDNLWNLRELPKRLVVMGGGPIGCELAQCFARIGSTVTQFEMSPRLLIREDPDVSEVITECMKEDGIDVKTNAKVVRFDGNTLYYTLAGSEKEYTLEFDKVLVATGRKANTANLNPTLDLKLNPNGTIKVDKYMCANPHSKGNIYAAGDIAGPYAFTHMAAHQAYYCAVNALFKPIKFKTNYDVVPWVTYTDPEVARVGINQTYAEEHNIEHEVTKYGLDDLDRAIADSQTKGFVKVITALNTDKILGATIVGSHAGNMNTEFIAGMQHGFGLNKILGTIHPYPTHSEANKYTAGAWKRSHTKPWIMSLLEKFHTWRLR